MIFNTHTNYPFEQIQIISRSLEDIIGELGLTFSASKWFFVFGDRSIVCQTANLTVISDSHITHISTLKYLVAIADDNLTFIPVL